MRLKAFYILFLIALSGSLYSQKAVRMSSSATNIFQNDTFEIQITLENFDSDVDIKYPDFKDISRVSGPFRSSRTSVVNGVMTRSVIITYRFLAEKAGTVTIEPATVTENGNVFRSDPLTINVLSQGTEKSSASPDLFLEASVSSTDIYVGEIFRITYTLYVKPEIKISLPSIASEPNFTGFVKENIPIPADRKRTLVQTIHNGIRYNKIPIAEYRLSPTRSGTVEIDRMTVNVPVETRTRRRSSFFNDPFFDDDIFSTFRSHTDRPVVSERVNLDITSLPISSRPDNFSGAVGSYSIRSYIDSDTVAVNEAVNIKIVISGTGNISSVTEIEPRFPPGTDIFNPKRTMVRDAEQKDSGSVVFEYLIIPRTPGDHDVGKVSFSFFNPSSKKYITVSSEGHIIHAEDDGSGHTAVSGRISGRNIEMLASEIRYIKKDPGKFYTIRNGHFSSLRLFLSISFIFAAAGSCYFFRTSYFKKQGDAGSARRKKAVKNKKKRLALSKASMERSDAVSFYKHINEALIKFIADKFNISHAGMISEEINALLAERAIGDDIVNKIRNILSKSESVMFASVLPGEEEMKGDLETAEQIMLILNEKLR